MSNNQQDPLDELNSSSIKSLRKRPGFRVLGLVVGAVVLTAMNHHSSRRYLLGPFQDIETAMAYELGIQEQKSRPPDSKEAFDEESYARYLHDHFQEEEEEDIAMAYNLEHQDRRLGQPFPNQGPEAVYHLDHQEERQLQQPVPKVAWLLGFPEMGEDKFSWLTSDFVEVIHFLSRKTTADNNGDNYRVNGESVPIYPDWPGPFIKSNLPIPEEYVLTVTPTHGACFDCKASEFVGDLAYEKYMKANNIALKWKENTFTSHKYNINMVKKLVILMHDPFDIVALRYFAKHPNTGNEDFRRYCKNMDEDSELSFWEEVEYTEAGFWEAAKDVPCRAEFVKVLNYYNKARLLAAKYRIETRVVHYKDFAQNTLLQSEVDGLLNFLQLPNMQGHLGHQMYWYYPWQDAFVPEDYSAVNNLAKTMLVPAMQIEFDKYLLTRLGAATVEQTTDDFTTLHLDESAVNGDRNQ